MAEINKITVAGITQLPTYNTQAAVFVKGTDTYENVRIGKEMTIETSDGKTASGQLSGKKVGALIELMGEYGAYNLHTFGVPYSTLSLIQALSDAQGEDPLDVTKLYTVLVVQVVNAPNMPPLPTTA